MTELMAVILSFCAGAVIGIVVYHFGFTKLFAAGKQVVDDIKK